MDGVYDFDLLAKSFEESIEITKACLVASLQKLGSTNNGIMEYISNNVLVRPTFAFIHLLVRVYTKELCFACGLYNDKELDKTISFSRQEKIRFIVKILACVATITNIRLDIYVSPARVISGREVQSTHLFFRCLAAAALSCSIDLSKQIASKILGVGENFFYRQSVKTRNAIIKMQAVFRGKRVKKYRLQSVDNDGIAKTNKSVQMLQIQCCNEYNIQDSNEKSEIRVLEKKREKKEKIDWGFIQSNSEEEEKNYAENIEQIKMRNINLNENVGFGIKPLEDGTFPSQLHGEKSLPRDQALTKVTGPDSPNVNIHENSASSQIDISENCLDRNVVLKSLRSQGHANVRSEINNSCTQNCTNKGIIVQASCESSTQTEMVIQTSEREKRNKQSDSNTLREDSHLENSGQSIQSMTSSLTQIKTSEMTLPNPSKKTKCKIINGIMIVEKVEKNESTLIESDFDGGIEQKHREDGAKKNICDDNRLLQSKLETQLSKNQERESKLKQRLNEIKIKEEQLELHEARVTKLAESFWRKKERLHQEGMKQALEMDKLRSQITEAARESHNQKYSEKSILDGKSQHEDILKRSYDHPTITDLRIKLERKERALIRRGQAMRKAEKALKGEKEHFKKLLNVEKDGKYRFVESRSMDRNKTETNVRHDSTRKLLWDLSAGFTPEEKDEENKAENVTPNHIFNDVLSNEKAEDNTESSKAQDSKINGGRGLEKKEQLESFSNSQSLHNDKSFSRIKSSVTTAGLQTLVSINLEESQKSPAKKRNTALVKKTSDKSLDANSNNTEEFPRRLVSYSSHYKELERQSYLIHPPNDI